MTSNGSTSHEAKRSRPEAARISLLWAVAAHVPGIASLHSQLFDEAWDDAAVARLLAHPGSIALVASEGSPTDVGGFALAQIAADEAEILSIGVTKDWQRAGVGVRLVDGIKRAAARAGAKSLFLEVAQSNAAALALYSRTGFSEAGRRKGYYVRPGRPAEDAIVMRASVA